MTQRSIVPTCPPEILEWIPWYAEGDLADVQRGAVEAHAAECAECRLELAVLSGAEAPLSAPEDDAVFARVLGRIEADAMGDARDRSDRHHALHPSQSAPPLRGDRTRVGRFRPSRVAIAAGLAVALGTAGWFAGRAGGALRNGVYHTAAAPDALAVAGGGAEQLDVVFRTDVGMSRINTDLRALGAAIVAGPSQAGRYRIALPEGSDASAAAAMLRSDDGIASFAEPLRP